jgi:retron-type reverse transcriptase
MKHEILIEMLETRIADEPFIRLIRKWLRAGILETDGQVKYPEIGTPQGGTVSPILSNIYLHHALDTWFEYEVKKHSEGEAYMCRYADDFVCAFRFRRDATTFYRELKRRLRQFGLQLSEEKTNIISFSRFRKEEKTKFDFLSIEFRWGLHPKAKDIKEETKQKHKRDDRMVQKE